MNEPYLTESDLTILEGLTRLDIQRYLENERVEESRAENGDRRAQVLFLVRWNEPWRSWIERCPFRGSRTKRRAFLEQLSREEADRLEDQAGKIIGGEGAYWKRAAALRDRDVGISRVHHWGQAAGGHGKALAQAGDVNGFRESLEALCKEKGTYDTRRVKKALLEDGAIQGDGRKAVVTLKGCASRTWGTVLNILRDLRK